MITLNVGSLIGGNIVVDTTNASRDAGKLENRGVATHDGHETVEGVDDIDSTRFAWNTTLKHLTIGEDVKNIGKYAFEGCSSLEKVVFKGKTVEDVMEKMKNYPWGIGYGRECPTILECEDGKITIME